MQARTARPNDEVKKLISTNETLYQQLQDKTTTTKDATSKAKQLKEELDRYADGTRKLLDLVAPEVNTFFNKSGQSSKSLT